METTEAIREWPAERRPRERLGALGAGEVSTAELLALVIGSGGAGESALGLATSLLSRHGGSLRRLGSASPADLEGVPGIGPARSSALCASLELGRRMAAERGRTARRISGPRDVSRRLAPLLRDRKQEEFWALYLDTQNRVLSERRVTVGLLNASLVHPREVFAPALRRSAASVVVAHNHPSGDPEPSDEDLAVTRQLGASGALLGIPLRDHVVLGADDYVSLRKRGCLPVSSPPRAAREARRSRPATPPPGPERSPATGTPP